MKSRFNDVGQYVGTETIFKCKGCETEFVEYWDRFSAVRSTEKNCKCKKNLKVKPKVKK